MARFQYAGGAPTLALQSSITNADTSFTASTSAAAYPDGSVGPFVVLLGGSEKVKCSSRSGNVFTVAAAGRGFDGTAAASHASGQSIDHCFDATSATDFADHVYNTGRNDHTQYAQLGGNNTWTGTQTFNTAVTVLGTTNGFGNGAGGGTGSYVQVGHFDNTNAIVQANSQGGNTNLLLRVTGTGVINLGTASTETMRVDPTHGVRIGSAVTQPSGSQFAHLAMANIGVAISDTPSSGGWLYVEGGALKYKGSSGTVTVLGQP